MKRKPTIRLLRVAQAISGMVDLANKEGVSQHSDYLHDIQQLADEIVLEFKNSLHKKEVDK